MQQTVIKRNLTVKSYYLDINILVVVNTFMEP